MNKARTVDEYMALSAQWGPMLERARKALLDAGLKETIKWGAPCYTCDAKNLVSLAAFSGHAALWFHQGVLLSDPQRVLTISEGGKAKAMRQWRIETAKDVRPRVIKAYAAEAIALQRAGESTRPTRDEPINVPPELAAVLSKDPGARAAFDALTPGKRREYADHVAAAKREATRAARVEKIVPMILHGKGLNDRYRGC